MQTTSSSDPGALKKQGRNLEYFTIWWNSLEGLVAIGAGAIAGSISLVGFGMDSLVEVTSGAALLWRMSVADESESRERLSLRIVGGCFLALAAYIAYEAIKTLVLRIAPERSLIGIVLACLSLVVMPLLSRAKHKIGAALNSSAMHADAKQTEFCTYLSAILLAGLLLNAWLGWWWADPVARWSWFRSLRVKELKACKEKPATTAISSRPHDASSLVRIGPSTYATKNPKA